MEEISGYEETGKSLMAMLVRFIGLFLLLAGLWVAIQVMLEALDLYRKPETIERFARAIEHGSNIDKSLLTLKQSITEGNTDNDSTSNTNLDTERFSRSNDIRISYFFAWVIVLLLLLLIARIAIAAIKTGGELVLYDLQVKHLAKALVRETSRINH